MNSLLWQGRLALLLLIHPSFLWSQYGTIGGQVIDAQNGEPLVGATVFLEAQTTKGAVSDIDGNFEIRGIAEGKHNLVIQYVSYETKVIQNIEVMAGKTTPVHVILQPKATELEEVVIRHELKKESINALLVMQKNATVVQDGISLDLIRKSPDKNTAEAIRRVSGVSLSENKFAIVRGLSDRYNTAMVNGTPLPSTEADRKNFTFDLIPSNMVDNILVLKTAQPDLPGDFAGGIIQVNTRDIPDNKFVTLNLASGCNTVSTLKPYYTYEKGARDFLGLDDGTRALPKDFPDTEQLQQADAQQSIAAARLLRNDWAVFHRPSLAPNMAAQLSAGIGGNKVGSIFSVTYNHSRRFNEVIRQDFNFLDQHPLYRYLDSTYSSQVLTGVLWNLGWRLAPHHKLAFKNSYTINSTDLVIVRGGVNLEQQFDVRNYAYDFTSNQLGTSQLLGEHWFARPRLKLDWTAGISRTVREQPNLRKLYYNRNVGTNEPYLAYVPVGSASPSYAGKFYSDLFENAYSAAINLSHKFTLAKEPAQVKTGVYFQHRNREFTARVIGYRINNPVLFYTQNENPLAILASDPADLFKDAHIGEAGFTIDEITNPSDHYTAGSDLTATYLMLDHKLVSALRVIWGARIEFYHQWLSSFDYTNRPVEVDMRSSDFSKLPFDLLPSANMIYSLGKSTNLRAAFSKTTARPEFRELAPFSFYDFTTTSVVVGNDSLVRSNIYNFDLRYEMFPGAGQVFSVGVFYKLFDQPIESTIDFISSGGYIRSYRNVTSAKNFGAELEIRKNLAFLNQTWSQFENFQVSANLSLIRSLVDVSEIANVADSVRSLQGQSPYVVNTALMYSEPKSGMSVTVLFNQIGRRIVAVGSKEYLDIYEHARPVLDLQVSKQITPNALLRLNVQDVIARKGILYQDVNDDGKYTSKIDKDITIVRTGTTFSMAFSYSF